MSAFDLLGGMTYVLALLGAVLALPTTWFLLRRYRKSILGLMNRRGGGATAAEPIPPPALGATSDYEGGNTPYLGGDITSGMRRNLIVVIVVGFLFALTFAVLLLSLNDISLSIYRLAFLTVLHAWPAVLGVWIVTGGRWKWVLGSIAIYVAALTAAGLIGGETLANTAGVWTGTLLPTAAIIAFLARPLRGVGPLVLGAMMLAILGSAVFATIVTGSETLLAIWDEFFVALGITDVNVMFIGLFVVGFVGALIIAVLLTRLLAGWYAGRGFSDQMLLLGAVFLVFAIDYAISLGPTDPPAIGVGLVTYPVTLVAALLAYRVLRRPPARSISLLMLRVFSPHRKSQRLLDLITARWRHAGPVRMIGGPDLAVVNVEPDEFFSFVRGDLARLFIDSPQTLEQRMSGLHNRPDPDGRYRVEEFFCFDDTWHLTVSRLLERSGAVLMDLRGFGPDNQGVIAEINMLGAEQALGRTVFLVDDRTDRDVLDSVLATIPGVSRPRMVEADGNDPDQAVAACLEAAGPVGSTPAVRFEGSD